jgi:hypothetical protein
MRARIQQKRQLNKTFHLPEPFEVNGGIPNSLPLFTHRWRERHEPTATLVADSRTTCALMGHHHGGTMRITLAVVALALAVFAGAGAVAGVATPNSHSNAVAPAAGMPYN